MPKAAHILLIEDDTSLAGNLCDVLKEDGFKVAVCNRGDEGVRRASNDECDVVLTDLRLPGLGGVEIVWQLRGKAEGRQVKDCEIGMTQNVGGSGATSVIHIMKRA